MPKRFVIPYTRLKGGYVRPYLHVRLRMAGRERADEGIARLADAVRRALPARPRRAR